MEEQAIEITEEVVTAPEKTGTAATTEESATSGTPTDVKSGADTKDGKDEPPAGVRKRIDELTRQKYEAAREAAYWKGQAEAKAVKSEPSAAPVEPGKPNPSQFADYDAYVEALTDYKTQEVLEKAQAETEKKRKKAKFAGAIEKGKAKHDDFEATTIFNPDLKINKAMLEVIEDSDFGSDVAYYLGKNPQEAARIAQLSPLSAAREIGKIETQFSTPQQKTETKKISDAPPPPSTVDGTSGGAQKDPSKMSDTEWFAWDKAERIKKMQARAQ